MKRFFFPLLTFLFLIAPVFALAQDLPENTNLILCNTELVNGKFTDPCTFTHFIQLAQNLINFIVYLAIPISAIVFAWAGWTILSAGDNAGQRQKAKDMFSKVVIGLFFILAAWLIIRTILAALVGDDYSLLGG